MNSLKRLKRKGIKQLNITETLTVELGTIKPCKINAFLPKQLHMFNVFLAVTDKSANDVIKADMFKMRVNRCKFTYGIIPVLEEHGLEAIIIFSGKKVIEVSYDLDGVLNKSYKLVALLNS